MDPTLAPESRLQATFVPALATLVWWGADDLEAALSVLGLPAGTASTCRLAVPTAEAGGAVVAPRTVGVRVAALTEVLSALAGIDASGDRVGASVRAWQAVARGEKSEMPTAAHASLNDAEGAIASADSTVQQFLSMAATSRDLAVAEIQASLRPYQVQGVAWLRALAGHGGGILADEMGLGKTLQAISLLATRVDGPPHLVVCPTSVLGNWRRELARFAPSLPVQVHHGVGRGPLATAVPGSAVLTSYSVLRSDAVEFAAMPWSTVILDEAQQIKNPSSLAAKAAAGLSAELKVAMTGTPVENRLDELWSIFHVVNPSVLGTRARFRQRFARPIETGRSGTAAARLTDIIEPYVLRRTKSKVATDLPAKQYATIACTLTAEQSRLYRAAVANAFDSGLGRGIARHGNVLALLTALKQICNHPVQFGAGGTELMGRSGKFDRASEMLAEIVDEGDRALVFTQYRAMGELLSKHLTAELGAGAIPFLHGGLSAASRDELVDEFQTRPDGPPVLILSLRAAGFGLNLTRASHVVHFDRWWNPAVEDQATDRAHRIGQHLQVNVHTLVTGGTIEDHIAAMHESKRAVADSITVDPGSTGPESALAAMSDAQLRELLELDQSGVF
ncbi:DEAD/DEAH box helicase [Tomitella biformata]|uniref:DEAD/DEAH box helicase n=1 Tax=Tomitella biformata TaxID=630403 RepID=UPI0004B26813|nr:DEAD/DEAH box helicase [Tomitella biformata]